MNSNDILQCTRTYGQMLSTIISIFVPHHRLSRRVLGPLHTLKNGSEGSQRIPIKHVCRILESFIRNFVFCMPKSHAGLFLGGYPYIMAREGVKRILPYIHACAQRK